MGGYAAVKRKRLYGWRDLGLDRSSLPSTRTATIFSGYFVLSETLFMMLMSTARAAVMPAKAGAKTSRSTKFTCSGKPSHLVRAARLPSLQPTVFIGNDGAAQALNTREAVKVSAANVPGEIAVNAAAADGGIKWGADLKKLGTCIAIGAAIWFIPPPAGVTLQAWHLLAIFLGTIAGIITQPLPLGAVAMLGLGASMMTGVLTFQAAFSAFASEIPWLIAIAFWLSGGFIRSGLGARIAYSIVSVFGKTTLGLTYSLVLAEALLAPAIPSVAARAGGLFLPLAKALCLACGSDPENGTEKKMGAYLMMTCFLCTTVSSGMFITAMAANPLAVNLALDAGLAISWGTWALSAAVPGLCCLLLTPALLYVLYPPEVKDTPDAPAKAKEELAKLGAMSTDEKITAGALGLTVALWIFGSSIGVNAVAAALTGLSILLVTGVVSWKQCLSDNQAWDTLTWFAALIAMAAYLNKFGFISWFSSKVVGVVGGLGLSWQGAFGLITMLYFYSHYFFASGAAHIGAMYTAFLSVAIACGTPGLLAALALGQLSNVMGCLTTYGIGSAPPYYGAGYVPQAKWYQWGFLFSVVYLSIWLGVGGAWWKVIGLW